MKAIGLGLARIIAGVLILDRGPRWLHAEVTYISPGRNYPPERSQFDEARLDDSHEALAGHPWSCSLYGVRSKLQVQTRFETLRLSQGELIVDRTSRSIVREHTATNRSNTYQGAGPRRWWATATNDVLDQIRLTKDGRLVSKLSVPSARNHRRLRGLYGFLTLATAQTSLMERVEWLLVVVCLALNALLAAAEIAFVSITRAAGARSPEERP